MIPYTSPMSLEEWGAHKNALRFIRAQRRDAEREVDQDDTEFWAAVERDDAGDPYERSATPAEMAGSSN